MKTSSKKKLILLILAIGINIFPLIAQEIDIDNLTKDEILELDYDQLLDLPFEDLMKLSDKVGVSSEDLLNMLMNRNLKSASKKAESATGKYY